MIRAPGWDRIPGMRNSGFACALVLLVCLLAAAGCGPGSEEAADGGPIVVEVRPFEVRGQLENADYVGLAFAGSLASNLAMSPDLEVVVAEGEEAIAGATHRISGTITRGGEAVLAGARLETTAGGGVLWETEMLSDRGYLSTLAARLARETVESLGFPYPDLYAYIGDVRGGPEFSASPLTARAKRAWGDQDFPGLFEASSELVARYPDDPAAQALDAAAHAFLWDAAPTKAKLDRLSARLAELDRVDPSSPYDEILRAYVYRSSGQPEWALELYSRILARTDLAPATRAWTLRQRCFGHQQVGRADAAREDAEEARRLDPTAAAGLFALSRVLEAQGELEEAIMASRQALSLQPEGWRDHQRLGLVLTRAARFDEATESLGHACDLSGAQEACSNYAVVLFRGGRPEEARRAGEYAASLGGSPFGLYNLACYQALAGQKTAALASLGRAVELGFADVLIERDSDLDSLRDAPEFGRILAEVEERVRSRRQLSASAFPWQS